MKGLITPSDSGFGVISVRILELYVFFLLIFVGDNSRAPFAKKTGSQPEFLSYLFPKLRSQPCLFLAFENPKLIFHFKACIF